MKSSTSLPIPVRRALRKLGHDIRNARLRRRITMGLLSERAGISRTTLTKIEKGDGSVSISIYATVIFILGGIDKLYDLLDIQDDETGLMLDEENLPKRIRTPSSKERKS